MGRKNVLPFFSFAKLQVSKKESHFICRPPPAANDNISADGPFFPATISPATSFLPCGCCKIALPTSRKIALQILDSATNRLEVIISNTHKALTVAFPVPPIESLSFVLSFLVQPWFNLGSTLV